MAMKKQGQEAVSDLSVLVENGGSYYCVIQDGKNWVLGKYNENLELQLKSPVNVKPATPITVTANGILVTASDGKARLLKTADLTMVTESDSVHAK
jgi:hypothetical protein